MRATCILTLIRSNGQPTQAAMMPEAAPDVMTTGKAVALMPAAVEMVDLANS